MPELAQSARRRVDGAPAADRTRKASEGPALLPDGLESFTRGSARARGTSAAHLLALQRVAGNRVIAASLLDPDTTDKAAATAVQRAPVATPHHPAAAPNARNDVTDLLNGFEDLAGAAVNDGGRHLDTVHFGTDLSSAHRNLLERIQAALIEAQEKSPAARKQAIAAWPALESRLTDAIEQARQLGLPADFLATVGNNLASVGEQYIHAPHRGGSRIETAPDYIDLLNGLNDLVWIVRKAGLDKTDAVVATNLSETNQKQRSELGAVQFGAHLTPKHRDLLENLRTAFIYARTESPGASTTALSVWKAAQGDLGLAMKRMPKFLVDPNDRSTIHLGNDAAELQQTLTGIGTTLFVGGAYSEAHNKAVKETNLQAPDEVYQEARLQEAAEGFAEVNALMQKALELTGENVLGHVVGAGKFDPELAHTIFELVKNPGDIVAKFKDFRKRGIIGKGVMLADIADKTLALRNAAIKVSCEVIKRFAQSAEHAAVTAGLDELAENWKKVAEWAEGKLAILEKVAKVAVVVALVVSAIKIIDFISQGKWGEALKEAGTTALGLAAAAAGGMTGTAFVGGITVIIAAEIEGISGAAAMIRYCKDQNVHSAAMSFINICKSAADIEARDLVADAKLLPETTGREERAVVEARLAGYLPYWMRHVEALSNLLRNDRPSELGGQPEVRAALGPAALQILNDPSTWGGTWEAMAEQIRILFGGANSMTKYVVDHYEKKEKPEPKEG
jgi:hypothetical protein